MGKDPLGARKKAWFMRWMVRPRPDIGVWHPPLNPADLRIPLDVNTGRAFTDLCDIPAIKDRVAREGIWFTIDARCNLESDRHNVEKVTQIARWIYPDDPARLDYAFFCYGRRFGRGEDEHRCWKIVGCAHCPIKESFQCKGR